MPRYLVKARLKQYWERAKEKVQNIPTYFRERHRVRELDFYLGNYSRRWGKRVVIENDVKRQLSEFAERNGLKLNYASFTRLKTSKSALDKIDRIKEQLSEAIPLGKGKFADCYEITLDSLRQALIPKDILGRVPLDENDLQRLYAEGHLPLQAGLRRSQVYRKLIQYLTPKGEVVPKIHLNRSIMEMMVAEDRVHLETTGIRVVFKNVGFGKRRKIPKRVLVFERQVPLAFEAARRGAGSFTHDAKGYEVLVLKKDSLAKRGQSIESMMELCEGEGWKLTESKDTNELMFKRKPKKPMPVGEDNFMLDFFNRKEQNVFPGAYAQVLGRETFTVHLNKDNERLVTGFIKKMKHKGWARNVEEEALIDAMYAFVEQAVPPGKVVKASNYIRHPKAYGYRGLHYLITGEKGDFELQLRTPKIDEEVRGIDEARGYHKKLQKAYLKRKGKSD